MNWLRVFEAAARAQSFSRAAESLNLSRPAVSQQIKALEEYLGKPLFVRGARRVRLTAEGEAFLPAVHQGLSSIEEIASALFNEVKDDPVTLQVESLLAVGWLPQQIFEFEKANPAVRLRILTAHLLSEFRTGLSGREPDLQIVFGSASDFPDSAVQLFGEDIGVVGHPDVVSKVTSLRSLDEFRLYDVMPHLVGWHQIFSAGGMKNVNDSRFVTVDNSATALMMASHGHGLALARSPASDGLVETLGLTRCTQIPTVKGLQHYYLVLPEAGVRRHSAVLLQNWILAAAGVPGSGI